MKTRESGMPEESYWHSFFSPRVVLRRMRLDSTCSDVAEIGCGYGTFTIPAAHIISGSIYTFDIEPGMVETTKAKAISERCSSIQVALRDVVTDGTGLPPESVDYFMLFNILHAEDPLVFLHEAHRVLRHGGRLGIVHWIYDAKTPRGPSMEIRPHPSQCQAWAEAAGFRALRPGVINLPPHHYGLVCAR